MIKKETPTLKLASGLLASWLAILPAGAHEGAKAPAKIKTPADISKEHFKKELVEILEAEPEIIMKALHKIGEREQLAQQEKIQALLTARKEEIAKDSSAIVLGKENAEVKLVIFIDPNCSHCRHFEQAISKIRETGKFSNVAFLIRPWPILGQDSKDVAHGLWALSLQGKDKFDAISKVIAKSEEAYTFDKLLAWVNDPKNDAKINVQKFMQDVKAAESVIAQNQALAQSLEFQGTPTTVLVNKEGIRLVTPTDEKSLEELLT